MPTQRPFFANFLAAFRAHSALKSAPTTSAVPTSATTTATAALSTQATSASASQPTASSTPPSSSQASAPRAISSPHKTPSALVSAAFSPTSHSHQHTSHHARHPSNIPASRSPVGNGAAVGSFGSGRRRGSDSSSEGGFRDALAGEKWFIGGRTALGEERFYRLGMARRDRSGDRTSLDRMSL